MNRPLRAFSSVTIFLLLAPTTLAENPAAQKQASTQKTTAAQPTTSKVIYDAWLTVTRTGADGKPIKYQYYNDRMELKNGRMAFQNHLWKKEDDFVNEEQIGAFADYVGDLTPTFFSFKTMYRSSQTTIDGTFAPSQLTGMRTLSVRIRRNGADAPPVKRVVPAKTILSTFFSTWVSARLPTWKSGQTLSFSAIIENDIDGDFSPKAGTARLEAPDALAQKFGGQKLSLLFDGQRSTWWVDRLGVPFRIDFPDIKTVAERATAAQAQAFFPPDEL